VPKLRLIGLTGGIGTGKSTVSGMLRELGATVVDADEGARAVVEPGTEGLRAVVAEFGEGVLASTGELDRAALAEIVFHDPERRARLNAITHPLVGAWMAERTAEAAERGVDIVVHDVPLLYENQRQGLFERVVLVYAPNEVAVRRLVERGLGEDQAWARIQAQMPIDEKRRLADHVIENSNGLDATRRQVEELWAQVSSGQVGLGE
jgi:dephospho-CoA kinase